MKRIKAPTPLEKTCTSCKLLLPIENFDTRHIPYERITAKCKKCGLEKNREWVKANYERHKEYHHNYYLRNREEAKRKNKEYYKTERGRMVRQAAYDRYIAKNEEKNRARSLFKSAVRHGKIARQPCSVCGELNAQGHHHDYSKPYDVEWLCRKHHLEAHGQLKHETPKERELSFGPSQVEVLQSLGKFGLWHEKCGWCFQFDSATKKLMEALVRKGTVVMNMEIGVPVYRLNPIDTAWDAFKRRELDTVKKGRKKI